MLSKKLQHILFFILLLFNISTTNAAIGDWKAYMAYHDVQEIEEAGNLIFVQASNSLYVYNKNDQSIQTFSKVDYLSDCEITHIAYNKAAKRLVILYSNGNIDLMNINNYEVTNLSDYYNASITEDKTVNDIYIYGNFAYLCTNFGIVKINIKDAEISDTYNLDFKVNWCEITGNSIYAYSQSNGKYSAKLADNLLDKNNWTKVGEYATKTPEDKSELKQLVNTLNPGGPKYNYFAFSKIINRSLYTCGGGVLKPGCIQVLNDNDWKIYQEENISIKTGVRYQDIYCLDVDPLDKEHLMAGGRNGLYEFQNGEFINFYNDTNSPIESYSGKNKEYELIFGIKYNIDGNLWMLNSEAPTKSLIEYTTDQQWIAHHQSALMKFDDERHGLKNKSLASLQDIFFDSRKLMWFVNNDWRIPSLYCYNTTEGTLIPYTSFTNEDGTTVSIAAVRCVNEDKNNNIWIGTNQGPLLLEPTQITANAPIFTQVKVPRNDGTNYADYLLSGVDITCLTIDKANRKWFGTKGNGIYVISSDNITQLYHFTASDSKLLSDNILSIAIDDNSGEVYIGTDKGLCSYQSDANSINENMNKDNVWAYPNPVKPSYMGNITITGLSPKANVKIVTSNGTLVNQGTSNGGTYIWDGTDLKGKKVASGIYMVATATENGEQGTVCKIAIIR